MNKKFDKIEKVLEELEEVNKKLKECVTQMAYLKGVLEGMDT